MTARRTGSDNPAIADPSLPAALDFAGLDGLLGYRLRRAQGAVHRDYLATLDDLKLTQKQTAVMWLIVANPGVAQGAIGTALGMDRATMMGLVDRLETRGLLQRRRSKVDARRRELHATRFGVRLLDQVRSRIGEHESRMASLFNAAELGNLERLLQRLQTLAAEPG